MGLDYVIDWPCVPKEALSVPGIVDRLKARARAEAIVRLYREHGDQRPASEMGVEVVNRALDGSEQTEVIVVQTLFDQAAALESYASACLGCPANALKRSFGCFGAINYPVSHAAEVWLLSQLPTINEPLPYLLLRQTIEDWPNLGQHARSIRQSPGAVLESGDSLARRLGEFAVSADQLLEMVLFQPSITPLFGAMLLLLFGGIRRDLEADELQQLTPAPADWQTRYPFQLTPVRGDDESIVALKRFFGVLHLAHGLNSTVSLDA